MNIFKTMLVAGTMALGVGALGASEAQAQSWYFGYGDSGFRNSYYGSGYGRRFDSVNRRGRVYHDTSHYDYHAPQVYRHRNHYHYTPGHYDFHQTGHWDSYGGGHHHHHH